MMAFLPPLTDEEQVAQFLQDLDDYYREADHHTTERDYARMESQAAHMGHLTGGRIGLPGGGHHPSPHPLTPAPKHA